MVTSTLIVAGPGYSTCTFMPAPAFLDHECRHLPYTPPLSAGPEKPGMSALAAGGLAVARGDFARGVAAEPAEWSFDEPQADVVASAATVMIVTRRMGHIIEHPTRSRPVAPPVSSLAIRAGVRVARALQPVGVHRVDE